jgi:hypothetical protein
MINVLQWSMCYNGSVCYNDQCVTMINVLQWIIVLQWSMSYNHRQALIRATFFHLALLEGAVWPGQERSVAPLCNHWHIPQRSHVFLNAHWAHSYQKALNDQAIYWDHRHMPQRSHVLLNAHWAHSYQEALCDQARNPPWHRYAIIDICHRDLMSFQMPTELVSRGAVWPGQARSVAPLCDHWHIL